MSSISDVSRVAAVLSSREWPIDTIPNLKYAYIEKDGYMDKFRSLAALAALGQETRLDVFRLLVRAGTTGVPAGEIAERLGAVQNTISAHLKILTAAGLVRSQRESRVIRYFADMTGFRDLMAYLMEDCCQGEPEICRPVLDAIVCKC